MHKVAEDISLKVFYKDGDDWISVDLEDITWSPECEYKIEEHRTAPVMPRWRLNQYDNDLCQLMVSQYRKEIEAYWKALDEFNGGKNEQR